MARIKLMLVLVLILVCGAAQGGDPLDSNDRMSMREGDPLDSNDDLMDQQGFYADAGCRDFFQWPDCVSCWSRCLWAIMCDINWDGDWDPEW